MQFRILPNSNDLVTVSPNITELNVDDIVLCKVKGREYVHLIKNIKVSGTKKLYLIGNNKGGINGWTGNIFGKVIKIG